MKTCKGCKHYKKDERTRLIVCEYGLSKLNYCEKDKEDFAIEELENLKAEILSNWFIDKDDYYSNLVVNDIFLRIDKHITELKGKNK